MKLLTCYAEGYELLKIACPSFLTAVLYFTDVSPPLTIPESAIHQQSVIDCFVVGAFPLYLTPPCFTAVIPLVTIY